MIDDLEIVKEELSRLKSEAEKYLFVVDTDEKPHSRHWADLPGNVRICFTKKFLDGKFYYHLSISAAGTQRVDDVIVLAILNMLGSPQKADEIPAQINPSVRHFMWLDTKGDLPN